MYKYSPRGLIRDLEIRFDLKPTSFPITSFRGRSFVIEELFSGHFTTTDPVVINYVFNLQKLLRKVCFGINHTENLETVSIPLQDVA